MVGLSLDLRHLPGTGRETPPKQAPLHVLQKPHLVIHSFQGVVSAGEPHRTGWDIKVHAVPLPGAWICACIHSLDPCSHGYTTCVCVRPSAADNHGLTKYSGGHISGHNKAACGGSPTIAGMQAHSRLVCYCLYQTLRPQICAYPVTADAPLMMPWNACPLPAVCVEHLRQQVSLSRVTTDATV